VRAPLSVLAGAVVAVIGAAVLGEYGFDGLAVIGSGLLLGLFVAEGLLAVAGVGSPLGAVASGLLAGVSMTWAGWIASGHRLGTLHWMGWAAVALAVGAGAFRARPPGTARRSRPAPASTE
jgi:hypothetical protein